MTIHANWLLFLYVRTKAYDKLNILLTNVRLINDIKKLSADAQISCLEGFHSTFNHWHPKMVYFSWLGTFSRFNKKLCSVCMCLYDFLQFNLLMYIDLLTAYVLSCTHIQRATLILGSDLLLKGHTCC